MIRAKKSLGQNFLRNPGVLDKIVNAAELNVNDVVLEIGPGTGILTEKLAEKASRIIAVEKDYRLVEFLRSKFSTDSAIAESVEVVEGDVLKFKPKDYGLHENEYKIVGNIPYYITSYLLRTIFEKRSSERAGSRTTPKEMVYGWPKPKLIVLMLQKEVAQRIMAKPPHMNLLALSVQFYSEPKIVSYVSKGSFRPIPKVDSAIITLRPKALSLKSEQRDKFFKIIKIAFVEKRKQLIGNLSKNFGIIREDLLKIFSKLGVKQDTRAENLSIEQWKELANYIKD